MRCKNCGWDSPSGNVKCEKCNAPLSGSMIDGEAQRPENGADEFEPGATANGCPACGYPIRPTDTECPVCGQSITGGRKKEPEREPEANQTERKRPPLDETIIQKTGGGKKLAGFLVTYSHSPNGDFFPVYEGTNSIGRNVSNDIVIADKAVSGEHLVIAYYAQNRKFYFELVGLTQNGAFVNGKFFPKGGDELVTSDRITIGSTNLLFMSIPEIAFEEHSYVHTGNCV